MVIPSKDEIKELENYVRTKLNEPDDFEFTGKINIDVRPYQTSDVRYEIHTETEPFEIDMVIYSARYPESFYNWQSFAIPDIRLKIKYNRTLKENERLKKKLETVGVKID